MPPIWLKRNGRENMTVRSHANMSLEKQTSSLLFAVVWVQSEDKCRAPLDQLRPIIPYSYYSLEFTL